ncbi:hypothetical protein ACHAPA_009105 [Fusarium lateritium]
MSIDRLSPSNTSSTQAIQTVANNTIEQPLLSKHLSEKLPRYREASSSSQGSATTVVRISLQLPVSALETQDSNMFSALIGHTRALLPQGELEGVASDDVGDFEHTPPPSNRASLDISKDEAEKPAASKRIDASLDTTSRHRLHKTSFNGSKFASKDKPASPASTPFSKTKSSMPLAEGLGAISGPPYHKPSSPQNGSAIDSIRTKPLMLSQDTHPSKGTVALAELYTSIEPMETSRDELQVCHSTQSSSGNSNNVFVGDG